MTGPTGGRADGMTYPPPGRRQPVVGPGQFRVAAMHLDHGHIYGQCQGLVEAGAEIVAVHDPDPVRVARFRERFPEARAVADSRAILEDPRIHLVAAAAVPSERGALGVRVMEHDKDYFTDKGPFTTLAQLAAARAVAARTGRKYLVYYSERLHVECAVRAGDLVREGAVGRVVQVVGLGPHRLDAAKRPAWFFERARYGGILCDIASHQVEQFLFYTGNTEARVTAARVGNYHHPQFPELEDFGDLMLVGGNGATGYHRVDWFTPDGLATWGDGRLVILGTDGYIELRKYLNVGDPSPAGRAGNHLFLVDRAGERHLELAGQVGFPFFGALIRDCLDRTETAMTQAHAFTAAELALQAQAMAERVGPRS